MGIELSWAAIWAGVALLWTAVAHAFHPRLAWSVPTGAAIVAALLLPIGVPGSLLGPALGVGAVELATALAVRAVRRSRPAAPGGPRRAPMRRLWSGELGPLLTFGSLLVWLLTVWYSGVAVEALPLARAPRAIAAARVALALLGPAGVAAGLVGLWRSAGRGAPCAPPALVSWLLVRPAVLCAWPVLALATASIAPDTLERFWPLAFARSERGAYTLRVLRGGRELEVAGRMGFGLGDDLRASLDAHPDVGILHLDSGGGRAVEAERVAALVRERRLTTYVAHECASACVVAFAAGEPRLLSTRARVGLHRASTAGQETASARDRAARTLVDALRASGVDEAFARRAAATGPLDVWWPTHDEIFASRLATRHAGRNEVAMSGVTAEALEGLALDLRTNPMFQAFYEFERPFFERWVGALRAGYARGQSEEEALAPVTGELRQFLDRTMGQDVARASDAAVLEFFRSTVKLFRAARESQPSRCVEALDGRFSLASLGERGRPASDSMDAALADVLISARLQPVEARPLATTDPVLQAAVARSLEQAPGWEETSDRPASEPEACLRLDGTVALYEEFLRRPPATGAAGLRGLVLLSAAQAPGEARR